MTGELAEMDLERQFTSWGWVVGWDRIDIGYDLSVVPDIDRYRGERFLVQSKGTATRKKGSIVAQISKARLRQYADNPHPVFLVRVFPDGVKFWLHAQAWAKDNLHRLAGSGMCGVKFDPTKTISNKGDFADYLDQVMGPSHERCGSLRRLAEQRGQYLSSLDPRFKVKVGVQGNAERYEVYAAPGAQDPTGRFTLKPTGDSGNLERFKEAIEYGVPATVEVDEFKFERSPLFDAIGASTPHKGKISIRPNNVASGSVWLSAGSSRTLTAVEVCIPAKLYSGQKGFVVSNEDFEHPLIVAIRYDEHMGKVTLTLNKDFLAKRPLQTYDALGTINDWIEHVFVTDGIRLDLAFREHRIPLSLQPSQTDLQGFLSVCLLYSRLHRLSKYFDSAISLPSDYEFSEEEENDILLAYRLLRGERCNCTLSTLEFQSSESIPVDAPKELLATTNLLISVNNQDLGIIPIAIEMPGFHFEALEEVGNYRVHSHDGGKCTIRYHDSDIPEGITRRRLQESDASQALSGG